MREVCVSSNHSSFPLLKEQQIFIEMYGELKDVRNDLEEDEEMISAAQIGALFVDWTDPLKLSNASSVPLYISGTMLINCLK